MFVSLRIDYSSNSKHSSVAECLLLLLRSSSSSSSSTAATARVRPPLLPTRPLPLTRPLTSRTCKSLRAVAGATTATTTTTCRYRRRPSAVCKGPPSRGSSRSRFRHRLVAQEEEEEEEAEGQEEEVRELASAEEGEAAARPHKRVHRLRSRSRSRSGLRAASAGSGWTNLRRGRGSDSERVRVRVMMAVGQRRRRRVPRRTTCSVERGVLWGMDRAVRRIASLKEVRSSSPPPAPTRTRPFLPAFHTVDLRVRHSDLLHNRETRRLGPPRRRRRWVETVSRMAARCRTGIPVDLRPQPRITSLAAHSNSNNNSGSGCRPTRSRDSLPRKAHSSGNTPPRPRERRVPLRPGRGRHRHRPSFRLPRRLLVNLQRNSDNTAIPRLLRLLPYRMG